MLLFISLNSYKCFIETNSILLSLLLLLLSATRNSSIQKYCTQTLQNQILYQFTHRFSRCTWNLMVFVDIFIFPHLMKLNHIVYKHIIADAKLSMCLYLNYRTFSWIEHEGRRVSSVMLSSFDIYTKSSDNSTNNKILCDGREVGRILLR